MHKLCMAWQNNEWGWGWCLPGKETDGIQFDCVKSATISAQIDL